MREIVCTLLQLYVLVLIARMIISWFPISPDSPANSIVRVLYTLTEPVLRPVRSLIPPVQLGPTALDLSPAIVFFGVLIVSGRLCP